MANSSSSANLVQTANVAAANGSSSNSSSSSSSSGAFVIKPVSGDNWKIVTLFAGFLGLTTVLSAAL